MNLDELDKISEVMTPLPLTIEAGDFLGIAQSQMELHGLRHLPVLDDGKLIGIISDRDIKLARFVAERFAEGKMLTVGEVCNREPYVVPPEQSLDAVALHMAEHRIGSALVAKNGELLGIFTATDACRWVGAHIRSKKAARQ